MVRTDGGSPVAVSTARQQLPLLTAGRFAILAEKASVSSWENEGPAAESNFWVRLAWPNWRHSALWLLGLALLVAVLVKGVVVSRTVCISRDGVDYIQYAIYLQREPWPTVFRESQHHPLYPLGIAVCQRVLFRGRESEPESWQWAAQLVNFLAGLLATPAVFLVAHRLVGRAAAFWVAVLINVLPGLANCLCDALSEGLYLAGVFWALALVVVGLVRGDWLWFALAGLACGLAYLTRPESALLAVSVLISLPLLYFRHGWPGNGRSLGVCLGAFLTAFLLCVLPYTYIIGAWTVKPSGRLILQSARFGFSGVTAAAISCPTLAAHIPNPDHLHPLRALYYVLEDTAQGFLYAPLILVVPGYILALRRLRREPGWLIVVIYTLIHFLVLWRGVLILGYIAERYTYPITVCGLISAALAWRYIRAGGWRNRSANTRAASISLPCWAAGLSLRQFRRIAGLALTALVSLCVGKLFLEPLHQGAAGHRQAGYFLRQHLQAGDNLFDPYGLAAFYSGYALEWADRFPQPTGSAQGDWWFVLNRRERDNHVREKLVAFQAVADAAQVVFRSDMPGAAEVVVYRVPAPVPSLSPLRGRYLPRVR